MTALPITPPPAARVGTALKQSSSPPGSSGGGHSFATLLNQSSARTAPAEGPKTRSSQSDQTRRRDADAGPRQDDVKADASK